MHFLLNDEVLYLLTNRILYRELAVEDVDDIYKQSRKPAVFFLRVREGGRGKGRMRARRGLIIMHGTCIYIFYHMHALLIYIYRTGLVLVSAKVPLHLSFSPLLASGAEMVRG